MEDRDIDRVIASVKARLPEAEVYQLRVKHPADDDGVWWFYLPGIDADVQIDSAYGKRPFLFDHTDNLKPYMAVWIDSVEEVAGKIVDFLSAKRSSLPSS
ncbi:MAG: hypothetical protein IAF94_15855 [Pirellulaceae bacterium]|nr:hypothetical protein [Pirellulaceae bacterium]